MRTSFQQGSIVRVERKCGAAWRFRWRENGVQRSEWVGTVKQFPLRAQAEKAAERFRRLANSNVECITMADLIEKFWKESPPERETTAASYRSIFKRIEAQWGSLRIDQFCREVLAVEAWLKDLPVIGRHPKRGPAVPVSSLYRGQVRNLLHLLIEKAMLWGHAQVERNPMDLIRLKGSSTRAKELVILTLPQYQALLDDPQLPETVKVMVQLAAGLGLRVSEILGLKWEDCDFEAKTIHIQRSVVHGKANDTKSKTSAATLPLHENLIEILRGWKAHEALKSRWVFCSERTGRPLDRDWLRSEYLQPAGERIGLPGLGFHSFRHTHRAMMRTLGIDMETQRGLMRHAKIATTINTYGGRDSAEHLRPENAKIVEMLPRRATA
jgi:integrase